MRRYALRVWMVCSLILVWILLWGTVSPANILSGLAIALVITLLLPLPVVPVEGRVHLLSLLRLIAQVAYLWCCPRCRWRGWRSSRDPHH